MATPRKVNDNKEILEALKQLDTKVTTINTVLSGSAEEDKPGLMERVRILEAWVSIEKRLVFIIVGVIVTDIITRLWAVIVK